MDPATQISTKKKCCGATRITRNEDVPCDNGPVGDRTYAVAGTAADQTQLNQQQTAQILLLPRKVTRWRSTRTRSISFAATVTEIDKTDVTDNGPCKPDLEACCQNISALLAACAAKNNTNGKYPVPTEGFIYGYMRVLFALLQLEPECCVYSYIYIKRLQAGTGVKIGAGNWKKLLIVSLLLASKFVDDVTLTNKDFACTLNGWSVKKINRLEAVMLQTLHWDIYVPISEYTTKYFELIQQPTKPTTTLNWQVDADTIEHYFNVNQKQYHEFMFHGLNLQHVLPYK